MGITTLVDVDNTMNDIKWVKVGVTALIYQGIDFNSNILTVSRKNNHNDAGLPGGKVDPSDKDCFEGMCREIYEETGLTVEAAIPLFFREDNDFVGLTYLVTDYSGEIHKTSDKETGLVKWSDFEELKRGSFSEYNKMLELHIKNLKKVMK